MLVSLDKNKWLYDWLQEKWQEELYNIITVNGKEVPRPNDIRARLNNLLISKGYNTKLTSKFDIIISMTEEEYILLKLKYE
jgi:hypothetical protein